MDKKFTDRLIKQALKEDTRPEDITTKALVKSHHHSAGNIVVKEDAILCGLRLTKSVFLELDENLSFKSKYKDGAPVRAGTIIARVKGKTRALLTAERVALNFLGYLSGIATHTDKYVKAVKPYKAKILDTRKTTPTLRVLERYAVQCGGGVNHRFNLYDMAMIKDNHRQVTQPAISIEESVAIVKRKTKKKIVVEVDNLDQFKEALQSKADVILLDNMPPRTMQRAVLMRNRINKNILLEASGGINLKTVKSVAKTGVDRISVGSLTHSRCSIDVSLEIM